MRLLLYEAIDSALPVAGKSVMVVMSEPLPLIC